MRKKKQYRYVVETLREMAHLPRIFSLEEVSSGVHFGAAKVQHPVKKLYGLMTNYVKFGYLERVGTGKYRLTQKGFTESGAGPKVASEDTPVATTPVEVPVVARSELQPISGPYVDLEQAISKIVTEFALGIAKEIAGRFEREMSTALEAVRKGAIRQQTTKPASSVEGLSVSLPVGVELLPRAQAAFATVLSSEEKQQVKKALQLLAYQGPGHPSLQSHKIQSSKDGLMTSHAGRWRVFWTKAGSVYQIHDVCRRTEATYREV